MKTNRHYTVVYNYGIKLLLFLLLISGNGRFASAQCPPNIDFEQGNFTGWQLWVGQTINNGGVNEIIWDPPGLPVPPDRDRHLMLTTYPRPGDGLDFFGVFPKNCPNGSGHSIQLGNASGGRQAEGASYTFTIPPGQDEFNLIYNYAVVFQDPGHFDYEQPRLQIEIRNLTDDSIITCSSFDFIASSNLPGFFFSTTNNTGVPVWCKNWSANSINLDNLAGKTIRLFFKTADCTRGEHFGYAYIDVNTDCSSAFIGATYCPDDAFINVTAPFGYETYTWWDATFTTILGNAQTINFTPPPPAGTTIAVVITPYAGYGCVDTLTAILQDTLTIQAQAGPDRLSCNNAPVQLGVNPRPGYVYSWSPATGLSNPNISNPIATPSVTTQYVLTVTTPGGGCLTTDTVVVSAAVLSDSLEVIGPSEFCLGQQAVILKVLPADSIQWYQNAIPIPGANQTQYNVIQTGSYHATLFSFAGCSLSTAAVDFIVNALPAAGFNINTTEQCFKDHQFIFTNTSSISSGTMSFLWDLGDGTTATTQDVTHSYAQPGNYMIKLFATSDRGCADSIFYSVIVNASPVVGFNLNTAEQCFLNNQFVFTNTSAISVGTMQYNWDMGNGTLFNSRDVNYSYPQPGNYIVKLFVTSDKGCIDSSIINVIVNASPVAGFTVNTPEQCFKDNVFNYTNTTILSSGTLQYLWTLGDGITATTADVSHNYATAGNFVVKMLASSDRGCKDSSTMNVKIFPYANADFYVAPVCTNLRLPLINKTVDTYPPVQNYLWDFGNGQSSTLRNPVYSYPAPGTYTISLTVSTSQCPTTFTTRQQTVVIDAPAPGISYPVKDAIMNFPEPLQARQIGNTVLWSPATSLNNPYGYNPSFRGINPQLYTIQLKTITGCLTVDTQFVKTHKKIEIYVPAAFTPGSSNGLNDYLRPVLMGFDHVNYFRVYNRWGKMLYQMQSDRPGWDGRVGGVLQEMQTVVWMIEAVDIDGNVYRRQGTTVLVR